MLARDCTRQVNKLAHHTMATSRLFSYGMIVTEKSSSHSVLYICIVNIRSQNQKPSILLLEDKDNNIYSSTTSTANKQNSIRK